MYSSVSDITTHTAQARHALLKVGLPTESGNTWSAL